ncbi:unnamed protein product [Protopolystoma xenopodis]|uniref:Uncharacterized protein n=1 Tax=Protopolystoma xenopodis TaxID=117903 RepID=A0A3S5CGS7_9PLAT|nr:unnamed protein product [Protopolystoma xenopodis]
MSANGGLLPLKVDQYIPEDVLLEHHDASVELNVPCSVKNRLRTEAWAQIIRSAVLTEVQCLLRLLVDLIEPNRISYVLKSWIPFSAEAEAEEKPG